MIRTLTTLTALVATLALPALASSAGGPPATTPPDPCELGLTPPGNANGLDKRCVAQGGGSGVARGDFNGDGIGDLAIGVPYEDLPSGQDAGAVNVIYGSVTQGLQADGNQFLTDTDPEPFDHFGMSLAAVDLNGDGQSELAVGIPDEDHEGRADRGAVQQFDYSSAGLVPRAKRNGPRSGGRFGAALAWGHFDGDLRGDLAIGIPGDYGTTGSVEVDFGGTRPAFWAFKQGDGFVAEAGVGDSPETGDRFGSVLAAGDHDGDGYDDLAIGVPYEDVGLSGVDEGMVHVVFGDVSGFRMSTRTITQRTLRGGALQNHAQFGRSLAMGNTGVSPGDELYIGAPLYDVDSNLVDSGLVYESRSNGTSASLNQGNAGEFNEAGDRFGWALAIGDFDGIGFDDLAIGSPAEDIGSIRDAGIVHEVLSPTSGFGSIAPRIWSQNSTDFPDSAEAGDAFGASLSAWNFGRGFPTDLAIGVPYEDSGGLSNVGFVQVTYGALSGLGSGSATPQTWSQAKTGLLGAAESNDLFGYSLY